MEAGFATNSQQPARDIPTEIYDSLWNIAMHGYQAEHVNLWYQTILHDLRQIASDNLQPEASGAGLHVDAIMGQCTDFLDTESAARRATLATTDSCISPTANFNALPSTELPQLDGNVAPTAAAYGQSTHDSTSQPYSTPQSYQTYTTTPQHLDTTPEPPQNQQLIPNWSPAPSSSAAEPDLYAISAAASLSNGNLMAFAGEPTNGVPPYHWFSTQDIGSLHTRTRSQQSHISQHSLAPSNQDLFQLPQQHQAQQPYLAPEYNTQLSGTAMPVLVPYASSASNGNYTKAAAIPTGPGASFYSSSAGYFPIIHVSSSRRRRKAIQKGVKKMVQPLKGRRQQSV